MATFKVGDKVRCITASKNGYPGIVGKVYEVKDIVDQGPYGHIYLVTDEPGSNLGCQNARFELASDVMIATPSDMPSFDSQLDEAYEKQRAIGGQDKGYVPDKIDWDKHKRFMRDL